MVLVAITEPLMTIPQIIDIYAHPGQNQVSLLTWVLYLFASVLWLFYGIKMRNRPLIWSGILWMLMEGAVVGGILLY